VFHSQHIVVLHGVKATPLLKHWKGVDVTRMNALLIELLVLGALSHLGRGLAFGDLKRKNT